MLEGVLSTTGGFLLDIRGFRILDSVLHKKHINGQHSLVPTWLIAQPLRSGRSKDQEGEGGRRGRGVRYLFLIIHFALSVVA